MVQQQSRHRRGGILGRCGGLLGSSCLGRPVSAAPIWPPIILFAENIGTYTGTWLRPRQMAHWSLVPVSKLTSWFLLMIISYSLVAWINGVRALDPAAAPADEAVALVR